MGRDAVLVGGSRDGESTHVAEDVTRLLAASDAPGLLDVYEADGSVNHVDQLVFTHVGQEPADGVPPDALHQPTAG